MNKTEPFQHSFGRELVLSWEMGIYINFRGDSKLSAMKRDLMQSFCFFSKINI